MLIKYAPENRPEPEEPRYLSVKHMIIGRIYSGEWPPRHKIPSESELVEEFSVSRMTVNRALRELSIEGAIIRIKGVGSFVAQPRLKANVLEVRNVAEEIADRGKQHTADVILLDQLKASPEIAEQLQVPIGAAVFHSIIVHREDNVPLQIEDRYVNPAIVPDYLLQKFDQITPNKYLSDVTAWTGAEHQVEAILPAAWEARLLGITVSDPCLLVYRRTFFGNDVVTYVRLLFAGSRYRIESHQRSHSMNEHP
jgi:GntR family transcriptional regulator, histidine utilization repressor